MTKMERNKVFSEAMEEGEKQPVGALRTKRKNAFAAAETYVDEVERRSFAWGYEYCLKKHGMKR
ncbi:MAG: hypothetical protein IKO03_16315 [Lachnospiraceae bacterium]|nr:hypothetical protein [Lachnospiraceae bacterium]